MSRAGRTAIGAVVALCALGLLAPLAWPLATGRIFALTDLGFFHVPIRAIYQEGLRDGYWPLWTPALFAGYYLHGEGQAGMFHPLHLLLYRTLPLGIAFNLEFLAGYVAALGGTWWFLRRMRLSRAGSAFGAMLFAFGGFQVLHFLHINMVGVAAHLPWLLASLDAVIVADRPAGRAAGFTGTAAVLGSAILLGFPQGVWWILLGASWFVLFRIATTGRVARLIPCAFAALGGVLLGGIQILPTLDVLGDSLRAEYTRSFALMYSLHPYNLLQLWSPYVFARRVYGAGDYPWLHELGVYSSAVALVAPAWLWVRRDTLGPHRALAAWTAGFAAVAFVLVLGRYGYLAIPLTYLPGVGSFRAPVRYIVLAQFALATLAAIAFDDLASIAANRITRRAAAIVCVPLLLSVLTAALVSTRMLPIRQLPLAPIATALAGTVIVAAVTAAVLLAAAGRRWALAILALATAADLAAWGLSYVFHTPPQTVAWQSAGVPPAPDRIGRYVSPDNWGNRVLLKGYRLAVGYAGLYPRTTLPYTDVPFQRLAGVRGGFGVDSTIAPIAGAVARARLLVDTRTTTNAAADIAAIDLDRTALVDSALPELSGEPGEARVIVDRPGYLVIDVVAPGRQLLSVTERYHPGWTASAGAARLPVVRINGDFVGCVVDGGTHRVELRFAPRSFRNGAMLSFAGAVLTVLGAAVMFRTRHV